MSEDWVAFCAEAPSRFYTNASMLVETKKPPSDCTLSGLSKEIWKMFEAKKQTREDLVNKIFLWMQLRRYTKTEFPDHGLFMAGSTLNGFGLKTSDVDFSFVQKNVKPDSAASLVILKKLLIILKRDHGESMTDYRIIPATIPLIKYKDSKYNNVSVDINCSNVTNIRNTYLLYCYSQVDWRVKPLAIVIKLWAKRHNIIDSQYKALSSYPLLLMLINFLQQKVSPPVLPCLQSLMKDKFKRDVDIKNLNFFEKLEIPFVTCNRQTLDELLREFFLYYSGFDFQKNVISVRKGLTVPTLVYKLESSHDTSSYSNGYVLIEEPFHLGNVGVTVRKLSDFDRIKHGFRTAYDKLKTNDSLDSILR